MNDHDILQDVHPKPLPTKDLPPETVQQTDEVMERIFSEWDKWFDNPPDERKIELRDLQNEMRRTVDEYRAQRNIPESDRLTLMELREKIIVLDKKLRQGTQLLIKKLWQK